MTEAHGVGGQADLPIPLELAIAGAVAALVVSFAVLVLAWRNPRYATGVDEGAEERRGLRVPGWLAGAVRSAWFRVALRVLGMVLFLYTAATAIFGKDDLTNPFFGIFYAWWWVGLVFASVLLGPVWRAISPMRTINAGLALLSRGDPDRGVLTYPERLGCWPAALGLFAFVWLELAYRYPTDLGSVRLWCALYVAAMLVGGAVFGTRFYERADPFEVYSTLAAKLSPWAVVDGRLVVRSPLANLATTRPLPGLIAVVSVLFGSTAFDSFSESSWWLTYVAEATLTKATLDNVALLVFCLVPGVLLAGGSMLTGLHPERRRSELPRLMAHSIVPIVVAYVVAHYLTFLVNYGTQTLSLASDPFGRGWDVLGTARLAPSYWLSAHPTLLATIKVLAVVVGHVLAAVAAHDRAVGVLPRAHQVTGQLPMLFVMVGFTAGGLFLLFNA